MLSAARTSATKSFLSIKKISFRSVRFVLPLFFGCLFYSKTLANFLLADADLPDIHVIISNLVVWLTTFARFHSARKTMHKHRKQIYVDRITVNSAQKKKINSCHDWPARSVSVILCRVYYVCFMEFIIAHLHYHFCVFDVGHDFWNPQRIWRIKLFKWLW